MKVLAGDLGGTKTLLCIAECNGRMPNILYEQRYITANWHSLSAMLSDFLNATRKHSIKSACMVVAGPVKQLTSDHQQSKITNVPWQIDSKNLATHIGISKFTLLNDFQGIAYGLPLLAKQDLVELQVGQSHPIGVQVLIGAGTGLGETVISQAPYYAVIGKEGGHVGFAPEDSQQDALLSWLRQNSSAGKRVTWEHILSGSGIVRIYQFLKETGFAKPTPELEAAIQQKGEDPAMIISQFGITKKDALANETLNLFVRLYGSEAANLALTGPATGGVFIAGGIAPKILPRLQDGQFIQAFLNKEPMRHLLENMPVKVVTNERVGLLGAIFKACQNY